MRDKLRSVQGRGYVPLIALAGVLLPIYVLSIGPAYWAVSADVMPETVIKWLYFPLIWLADELAYVNISLYWYIRLWAPI